MELRMTNGERVDAEYVKHLRTFTAGGRNTDAALYRLPDGRLAVALSPSGDGRAVPAEDPDGPAAYGVAAE